MANTLVQHREKVIRLANGGIITDETKYDNDYIDSLIDDARAMTLRADYQKYRRWSPQAMQTFYPEYEEFFQDSVCYTRFTLPTGFIQGNAMCDGLIYFGSSGGQILNADNFDRIKNRAELTDFTKNHYMSPSSGVYIGIMIEGLTVTVVGQSLIKYPLVVGVFENPSMLPNYSIPSDPYPISDDLTNTMYDIIKKSTLLQVMAMPPDTKSDSTQSVQQPSR